MGAYLLLTCIALPFFAVISLFFIQETRRALDVALGFSLLTFLCSVGLWVLFANDLAPVQYHFITDIEWASSWNIHFSIGIDGISLLFIVLTAFLTPACLLASWESIQVQQKEFFMLFMLLEGFLMCVFSVLDLILFYIFFESVLIPMFILVGVWGSSKMRIMAAYQLFLYTVVGGVFGLIAILAIYSQAGTTDFLVLNTMEFSERRQILMWLAFFISFAVKIPMVPVHLWLPKAHVEAPTAGSVILAGILLKLGGYGFLRISLPWFPEANAYFTPLVFLLSVIAIVYTSLTTLQQTDLKRVIAYSSVNHMGFVTLGLFTFNQQGVEGAIMIMVSHGIVAASLFLLIGFIYDRHHTREIGYYGGVVYTMPVYGSIMFFFMMANISLPGTAPFIGEFMVLLGAYSANTTVAVFSTTGVILGCAYSLWLMNRILFGNQKIYPLEMSMDLNRRETYVFIPLIILTLWFGMYPKVLLDIIHVPVTALLYNGL
jgi:NADH-quinone oxidoreductase subunit M